MFCGQTSKQGGPRFGSGPRAGSGHPEGPAPRRCPALTRSIIGAYLLPYRVMPRYRFAVEYLGTKYAGWQIQPGQATVEGELERALGTALRAPVDIVGSGRTDAGVHALGQVAHFDFDGAPDPSRLERSVNALTPPDICIRRLEECPGDFHARFDAVTRYYRYRIALRPIALHAETAWICNFPLDVGLFARELNQVIGLHNFANFSVARGDGKSEDCTVVRAEIELSGIFLFVHVEANRFLHKMVRAIVGAGFEVARKRRAPGLVQSILSGGFDGEWVWAPPGGLCLEKVKYSDYEY